MATMDTNMRGIDIVTSTTTFVEIFEINLPKGCGVRHRGLVMDAYPQSMRNIIKECRPQSSSRQVSEWQNNIGYSTVLAINGNHVYTAGEVITALASTTRDRIMTTTMILAPLKRITKETAAQYISQMQMDQLRAVTRHL